MKTDQQRESLIETGVRLMHEQGYGATGVREITAAAGVPQGSFTNHFRSKEAYAGLVLDRYFTKLEAIMAETLADASRRPGERLAAYFDRIESQVEASDWQRGCLLVDMAAEVPAHSDLLRKRLDDLLARQASHFERVLADASSAVTRDEDERRDTAAFLIAAWQGTLLRMKVERGPGPLRRFRRALDRYFEER